jgi:hypothetical protein
MDKIIVAIINGSIIYRKPQKAKPIEREMCLNVALHHFYGRQFCQSICQRASVESVLLGWLISLWCAAVCHYSGVHLPHAHACAMTGGKVIDTKSFYKRCVHSGELKSPIPTRAPKSTSTNSTCAFFSRRTSSNYLMRPERFIIF